MLLDKPFQYGNLKGVIFDFQTAGDILPKHSHLESDVHITVVARGRIHITGDGWNLTVHAGQVVDFNARQAHEIKALEDNTRIVNIQKA